MRPLPWIVTACVLLSVTLGAQTIPRARLDVLAASVRRSPTAADIGTLRLGARGRDTQAALWALRALGRLERPALITDLLPALRHSLPETRTEAAHAIGQAAQGWRTPAGGTPAPSGPHTPAAVLATLADRLEIEDESSVRAAIYQAIGRLPYRSEAETTQAEAVLLEHAARHDVTADRLGIAQAFETLVRTGTLRAPSDATVAVLRSLAGLHLDNATRDVRVRRMAVEALLGAGAMDDDLVRARLLDPDAQVRRLAIRAATISGRITPYLVAGLDDPSPSVRLEALAAVRAAGNSSHCALLIARTGDVDPHVALSAIDGLDSCGDWNEAVSLLERLAADDAAASHARTWHPSAHAIVALAHAHPERARAVLGVTSASRQWTVRLYAVRAAAIVGDRDALMRLAADANPNVAEGAQRALGTWRDPARGGAAESPDPPAPVAADLRRLAAPRAAMTIHGVGTIEFALLTNEAPATVLRFVTLAESGYYDGLTFHQVVPGVLARGGSAGASSDPGPLADVPYELGPWPHVRGTVAMMWPAGGEGQFFVNLTDNPSFDHEYTVFAQVLNGIEHLDRILEGDVIDRLEIIP